MDLETPYNARQKKSSRTLFYTQAKKTNPFGTLQRCGSIEGEPTHANE
jgi:hypothetical protein